MKKLNKTLLYLILTFSICYIMAGIFYLCGGDFKTLPGVILGVAYMFIPTISVLIIGKLDHKESIKESAGISFKINKWFLIAWLLPPVIAFGAFAVSLLFPDISYSPEMDGFFERYRSMVTTEQLERMRHSVDILPVHPVWLALIQGLFAGITVNAVAGFGEELGWRGFLLRQFSGLSFFKASVIIGFIWGIWHMPPILMGHNYPQHPQSGVLMMIVWCILLAPIFNYIRLKSGSVIAVSVLHGTLNGTAGIPLILLKGGNDLVAGITGLAGLITLLIVNFGLYIYDNHIVKENLTQDKIGNYL